MLRPLQVLQIVLSQVSQFHPCRQLITHKIIRDTGE